MSRCNASFHNDNLLSAYIGAAYDGTVYIGAPYDSNAYIATLVYPSPFIPTEGDVQILL